MAESEDLLKQEPGDLVPLRRLPVGDLFRPQKHRRTGDQDRGDHADEQGDDDG